MYSNPIVKCLVPAFSPILVGSQNPAHINDLHSTNLVNSNNITALAFSIVNKGANSSQEKMSFITSVHPVPDVSGVVSNICTFCDASEEIGEGFPAEIREEESLDLDHLVSLLREITKEPSLSQGIPPGIVQVERESYEIEQPQWIFCLKRCNRGGAIWSDGVRKIEIEECNIIRCINGKLEASDGRGGLYLILM